MIITGENTKLLSQASKDASAPAGTSRAGGSSDPPSYQATQPPFQPYVTQEPVLLQRIAYRKSPAQRFCTALGIAILIWILASILIQSWFGLVHWGEDIVTGDFPIPSDVSLSHCVVGDQEWSSFPYPSHATTTTHWTQFPHSSSATFDLPLASETLFLMAQGSQTRGTVNIITSEDVSNVVKVHFTVQYTNKYIRDQGIKICLIQREGNAFGVGYFTRGSWHYLAHSTYEATVVIPVSRSEVPLHINKFTTDMVNTHHKLGDLQDFVSFSHISLRGSNSPIYAKSVFADTGVFRTSNGAITGSYNSSRSLALHTSNAPILADVAIANEDDYVSDLTLTTSNGQIESRVALTSATEGGRYMAAISTSNAPLTVDIATSPLSSTSRVTASTSNSPALISLPSTYEGWLSMSTSNGAPSIRRRDVSDPSGQGRVRKIRTTSLGRNALRASVSWSGEGGDSRVELRSSNSPIVVDL